MEFYSRAIPPDSSFGAGSGGLVGYEIYYNRPPAEKIGEIRWTGLETDVFLKEDEDLKCFLRDHNCYRPGTEILVEGCSRGSAESWVKFLAETAHKTED